VAVVVVVLVLLAGTGVEVAEEEDVFKRSLVAIVAF